MTVFKVSSTSEPQKVAGAISSSLKEHETVELQAIGAAANNNAIKAVAIARGFLAPLGLDIIMQPLFVTLNLRGEQKTAIRTILKRIDITVE